MELYVLTPEHESSNAGTFEVWSPTWVQKLSCTIVYRVVIWGDWAQSGRGDIAWEVGNQWPGTQACARVAYWPLPPVHNSREPPLLDLVWGLASPLASPCAARRRRRRRTPTRRPTAAVLCVTISMGQRRATGPAHAGAVVAGGPLAAACRWGS